MSLFGRKPRGASPSSPTKSPTAPIHGNRDINQTIPHSRPDEHATEAPHGADLGFCYGDDQES